MFTVLGFIEKVCIYVYSMCIDLGIYGLVFLHKILLGALMLNSGATNLLLCLLCAGSKYLSHNYI